MSLQTAAAVQVVGSASFDPLEVMLRRFGSKRHQAAEFCALQAFPYKHTARKADVNTEAETHLFLTGCYGNARSISTDPRPQ